MAIHCAPYFVCFGRPSLGKATAITKIKEMESPLFHKLLIQKVLTFKCQFLGTQDVMSDVMCAEALKKYMVIHP